MEEFKILLTYKWDRG